MGSRTTRRTIDAGWRLREAPREGASPTTTLPWIPATVPGHLHLDLVRAGVIGHPYYRMMERSAGWVDESDWDYEVTFTVDDLPANPTLVFHGLDTIAEVWLNDQVLGTADNMFVAHEFPADGLLQPGLNTLRVRFQSALKTGRARRLEWDEAGNDTMPANWFLWGNRSFVRKAQYMYGWDWGPEPVSAGIWRPVELLDVPVARILDWRWDADLPAGGPATVRLEVFVERASGAADTPIELAVSITGPAGSKPDGVSVPVPPGTGRIGVSATFVIPEPRLWYPNGQRDEAGILYTVDMALQAGETLDSLRGRIGLRSVELIREPDPDGAGEGFMFRVNGEDLFIKGANWIPPDSFPGNIPNESLGARDYTPPEDGRVRSLLLAARDGGINMIRVWGGGFYESDHFYETCDELGILVWQDFPYACAYYPDTGVYAEAAREEAIRAVRRLRSHPSLALWCGNNENDMMLHEVWQGARPPRYLGDNIYRNVLPAVLVDEDPGRIYWPSSPAGGDDPNSQHFGDRHNWDVWHGVGDWVHYPEDRSRFVSEFGFSSSCGLAAWDTCLEDSDKSPRSPAVQWHDKTRKGYETYLGFVLLRYPEPQTLSDLVYYSQLNQAEALKCAVEHYRRLKGRCWGTLFWQLNDCWPVQSWSVIDYVGDKKAAYYAMRRFFAPVLLSLVREDLNVSAHLTSDLTAAVSGTVTLRLEDFEGRVLAEERCGATVGPNGTIPAGSLHLEAGSGMSRSTIIHARFDPDPGSPGGVVENTMLLAEPKDLFLADPGLGIAVEPDGAPDRFIVTVQAQRFAPYVWLRRTGREKGEPLAGWSDNFFHLRAGESRRILLETPEPTSPEEVLGRLALRSM